MTTDPGHLTVSGIRVAVVRKAIKNLHLGVYPPDGRVRVAAPRSISDAAIHAAVVRKIRWIRRHQATFANQARQSDREFVSGESHYFLGRRYRLDLIEGGRAGRVRLGHTGTMELHAPRHRGSAARARIMDRWYREQLRDLAPPLLLKWQSALGVTLAEWGIKRMKTRWGSCNPVARRIWLNLELAKKSPECIEYLIVHELAHLRVRNHGREFVELMDQHVPRWRLIRKQLNQAPLRNDEWPEDRAG